MIGKLKNFGLALGAALALTAVMASSAMAFNGFTSSFAGTTTLHGVQEGSYTFTASASGGFGAVTCSTVTSAGTMSGTSSTSQTLKPTYAGCKDSFGRTVHVITNTLVYVLTITGKDGAGTPIGTLHVSGHIETTTTTGGGTHCTTLISKAQTWPGSTAHNIAGGGIRYTDNFGNVIGTTTGGFFNCGIANGEHTDGQIAGTTVLKGTSGGGAVSISVDAT